MEKLEMFTVFMKDGAAYLFFSPTALFEQSV